MCNDTKIGLVNESLRILVELNQKLNWKLKISMKIHTTQNRELAASTAKRLIVVQQLRKTIFIYASREIRAYRTKFIPLSNYWMLLYARVSGRVCVYVHCGKCVCVILGNHMVSRSFTHIHVLEPNVSGSFLCNLICEPRHTTSSRCVCMCASLLTRVFSKINPFFISLV